MLKVRVDGSRTVLIQGQGVIGSCCVPLSVISRIRWEFLQKSCVEVWGKALQKFCVEGVGGPIESHLGDDEVLYSTNPKDPKDAIRS